MVVNSGDCSGCSGAEKICSWGATEPSEARLRIHHAAATGLQSTLQGALVRAQQFSVNEAGKVRPGGLEHGCWYQKFATGEG